MLIENQIVEVKWNGSNRKHYESKGYIFTESGETFEVKISDLTKGSKSIVRAQCDWCSCQFERQMQLLNRKNQSNHFCSNKCQHDFRSSEADERKLIKNCKECEDEFKVKAYRSETANFCSTSCLSKWQSKAFKGENSPIYVERLSTNCDWCNSELTRTANKLNKQDYNFCNRECQQNWHRNIFSKSEVFLETTRKTMLNNLAEGKIKFTETEPHLKINKVLDDLKIKYINEEIVSDYSFDIYLPTHELYLEINGGYWHCDNRHYTEIQYESQLDRIIKDKRKRTYLFNNFNKEILYLWEYDIDNSIETCTNLILSFIENSGKLINYHSMNYFSQDSQLSLNDKILIPYMERSIEEISPIINLEVRQNVTKYDKSKHITFNCDYCGTEKTQLLWSYNKAKNHFCSISCNNKYRGQLKQENKNLNKTNVQKCL